jgi:O-antigen ligase
MMVIFIFIGLFVVRAASARLGWAIVVLALGFLAGAGGKTAIALALPVLALAQICFAMDGNPLRRAAVAIGLLVVLNFATVGSAYFTSVRSLNEALLPDATFSGRVDVWRFAIESIQRRPLTGYGFAAFWRSDEILSSENTDFDDATPFGGVPVWIKSITHAHNGFVEIAVTTGIPGLLLILGWIVVAPLIDYGRVKRGGPEQALAQLFFRIWLFGIYFSSLEGVMFNRAHPVWFLMLFSVFGLYMLSRFNLRERGAAS